MSTSARKNFDNYKNRYGKILWVCLNICFLLNLFVFPTFFQQFNQVHRDTEICNENSELVRFTFLFYILFLSLYLLDSLDFVLSQ